MEKEQRDSILRIVLSAVLLVLAMLFAPKEGALRLLCFLVPYLIVGFGTLKEAITGILKGEVFDECFLMAVATIGALCLGEYPEAVFVMLLNQVGETFEDYAVGKSRKSVSSLMDIRPDSATVMRGGESVKVSPAEVQVGERILIAPGERVPLDGLVVEGASSLDTAPLTGESMPRDVQAGDDIISGCVNLTGLLTVQTTKPFGESTVSRILNLMENEEGKKARAEKFITRFSRVYTPAVVILAVLLCAIPSLLFGNFTQWLHRALVFLVISCPCALVISVPLTFFGGIGASSKRGILAKNGASLEALSKAGVVVFDKTGTLTRGVFNVTAIHPDMMNEEDLLEVAALAESYSNHPIARSLRDAYAREIDERRLKNVEAMAGYGVTATIDGRVIHVGSSRLMDQIGATWRPCHHTGTIVHVAVDRKYAGHIVISDEVKPDAADAVGALKALGIHKTVMLTGDRNEVGQEIASRLGLDETHAQLLPEDKVSCTQSLLKERASGETLLFVGDGLNDAPVLTVADVGIAMGGMGSDAAIEAADIVLMDDKVSKVALSIRIARRTLRIARENIVFALAVKVLVLVLGALGLAGMWAAVFADVGVSVLAILNALRALNVSQAPEK